MLFESLNNPLQGQTNERVVKKSNQRTLRGLISRGVHDVDLDIHSRIALPHHRQVAICQGRELSGDLDPNDPSKSG
jgi:hypothetical protein